MKLWLKALAMCQSMFCALPFPFNIWDEKARDKMLLCLPVVGLEIGLIWYGAAILCAFLQLPNLMTALVIAVCPWVLTGQLHLDGFMDVTDAVRSYRSLERRREILKDSHVGSFAVIGMLLLLAAQLVSAASLPISADLRILIVIPALSRCGSVLAVIILPPMTTSQYAARQKTAANIALPALMALVLVGCSIFFFGRTALALAAEAAGYLLALRKAYRSLEGMNGDISGYALTLAELAALAALALL